VRQSAPSRFISAANEARSLPVACQPSLQNNGNACLAGGIFPDRTALALTFFLTRRGFGSLVLTAFMAARDQWEATSVKKSTEGTCLLLQCAM
jgi:hypothetical protein